MARVIGDITRGTTNPNRLRRMDRWILFAVCPTIRATPDPLIVDLGYGQSPITTLELFDRLVKHVRPDCEVVGIEIDPERVTQAQSLVKAGLSFRFGGFEVPLDSNRKPIVIRAANVLRQYDESQVRQSWATMTSRLAPDGFLVEGTCDEIGRRSTWVSVRAGHDVPESLTLSFHVGSLEMPSDIAPRLPKALIHRNVPGEKIYDFLHEFDRAWLSHANLIPFGARQRFVAAIETMVARGVPIRDTKARWRLGEVTVPWETVSPTSYLG